MATEPRGSLAAAWKAAGVNTERPGRILLSLKVKTLGTPAGAGSRGKVHRFKTPVEILGAGAWSAEKSSKRKVQNDLEAFMWGLVCSRELREEEGEEESWAWHRELCPP